MRGGGGGGWGGGRRCELREWIAYAVQAARKTYPVPFAPMTTFKRGPGATVTALNVRKFRIVIFTIIPLRYRPTYADGSIPIRLNDGLENKTKAQPASRAREVS